MTPEEKSLLERTYKMSEENNKILRSMRRASRFGTIVRVLYWVVIIGLSIGAFYVIQPYINLMTGLYGQAQGTMNSAQGAANSLKDLLK